MVDNIFSRELEAFKYQLQITTEEIRFDYQNKFQGFNIYIQNKYEGYEKLQRYLVIAESRISYFYGFRSEPTYDEYNRDDFNSLLEKCKFASGTIEELFQYYKDRKTFNAKLRKLLKFKEIRGSEYAINELRNHYWMSKFYLSEKVDSQTKEFIDKSTELQIIHEMIEILPYENNSRNEFDTEANEIKNI